MKNILISALVAALVGGGIVLGFGQPTTQQATGKRESAYDRVIRTKTIRCGYGVWAPFVLKDSATGEMSGLFVDMVEVMGQLTGMKIEWTSEVDWGQVPVALRTGKIDAHCAGMWPDGRRAQQMAFTLPLTYMVPGLLVRDDDKRFPPGKQMDIEKINNPDWKVGTIDGDVIDSMVRSTLPNAQAHALPLLANFGDLVAGLGANKFDFTLGPKVAAVALREAGANVRFVELTEPLQAYGNVVAIDISEHELWHFLNASVREMLDNVSYDRIFAVYEKKYPGTMLKPASAYQIEKK